MIPWMDDSFKRIQLALGVGLTFMRMFSIIPFVIKILMDKMCTFKIPRRLAVGSRVVVDMPSGPYGTSFGMSSRDAEMDGWSAASGDNPTPGGPGVGVVYPDNIDAAVKEVSRFSTTTCEDEVIEKYLKSLVGNAGQYHYLTNSCRNFSDREYANVVNMIMRLRAK